jgi:alkylation response protein AidB-like acyl-CoA dehydrogenase
MNFELSSEQKMLRDTVATFSKQKSTVERFREVREKRRSWDADVWAHMGELGWLSVPFAEDIGGFGGDFFDVMIIVEGLGKTLVPEPFIPSVVLGGMAIAEAGNQAQQERWLAPMIEGKSSLCLAYAERSSRFDPTAIETTATKSGGGFKLSGRKEFVLNGHRADQLVVSARTDGGVALFVIDRDAPGVEITEIRTMDGHGAAMVGLDTEVEADRHLAGSGADAGPIVEKVLDYGATAACAESLGVAQATLDMTKAHLKEREQFGVPIGTFQALQHRAVDMFVETELMRSMAILAAGSCQLDDADERRRAVSAAKAHVARSGRKLTQSAIQLHGGIGITDEHDVGLYFKRMHVLGMLFGDEEHHVHRFASLPTFTAGIA